MVGNGSLQCLFAVEYAKKLIIPSFVKKKVKAQIIATVSLTFFVKIVANQTSFYEQREASC